MITRKKEQTFFPFALSMPGQNKIPFGHKQLFSKKLGVSHMSFAPPEKNA